MTNREKLVNQLFIGKVSEIIGIAKTAELLKEANDALPKCEHDEKDPEAKAGNEFIGYYCKKCDDVYSQPI